MRNRFYTFLGITSVATANPLLSRSADNDTMAKSWEEVPLASSLSYVPCFEKFECANLQVPLDYEDPSAGSTNVAFTRWNTPNQPAKGDIILNPGGPGESGVNFVLGSLETMTDILGTAYNLVGMDPRGVNNSGPHLDCFPDQPWVRDYYDSVYYDNYDPRSDIDLLNHWTDAGGFGEWCAQKLNQTARYANTPATARDMLTYAELLAESKCEPQENAKLYYYGGSYGATLGTTFASLFPNRVGRMVIDAVVDAEEHYSGSWLHNNRQADEAIMKLFEFCFEAGPACAYYKNDSSAKAMQSRFDTLLADLKDSPISVSDPRVTQFPTVITWFSVVSYLLTRVYNQVSFPEAASNLALLEERNATWMIAATKDLHQPKGSVPASECDWKGEPYGKIEAKVLIACNDQQGNYNLSTPEKFKQYVHDLDGVSHYLGSTWSQVITVNCRKHAFVPPESQLFKGFKETHTANPILFTKETVDPAAPDADKMSSFFPGSIVMTQDAVGHGLTSGTSNCTLHYLSIYLETGKLPPPGTVCEIKDPNPFLTKKPAQ